jgi:hypothetical protein
MKLLNCVLLFSLATSSFAGEDFSFHADFDKGTAATASQSQVKIIDKDVKNVVLKPGIEGQALFIGPETTIRYPLGDVLDPQEGTFSFWFNLKGDLKGGFSFRDLSFNADGQWGKMGCSPDNRNMTHTGSTRVTLHRGFISVNVFGKVMDYTLVKQVFSGEWHNLTFTWKSGRFCKLFIDGNLVKQRTFDKPVIGQISKDLILGRWGWRGFNGALDEIKIYKRELPQRELRHEIGKFRSLSLELWDYAAPTNTETEFRFNIKNISAKQVERQIEMNLDTFDIKLAPGESKRFTIKIRPDKPGPFMIVHKENGQVFNKFECYAFPAREIPSDKSSEVFVQEIDCTKDLPADQFGESAKTVVKNGFRELADLKPGAGFAYRMSVANPGKPHWLEIEYPDNATRTYVVNVFPSKFNRIYTNTLDTIGIITGGDYPLSGKLQTKRLLFWPDSKELAVAVMAYRKSDHEEGPAIAKLRLYEQVGSLPEAEASTTGRSIGLWQEDPSMLANLWFNNVANYADFDLNYWYIKYSRIISYMKYMGINSWTLQTADYFGDVTLMKNNLPNGSYHLSLNGRVPGWDELGASMLNAEDFSFFSRMNVHPVRDRALAPWFQALLPEGTKQTEIMMINSDGHDEFAVNPHHPAVKAAFKKLLCAYRDKYKVFPNYRGMNAPVFKLAKLKSNYGDWTIGLFEKETGINIPCKQPRERYEWLMREKRTEWIKWRSEKSTETLREYAEAFTENGKNGLILQAWLGVREFLKGIETWPNYNQDAALLECGIDLRNLSKLKNVDLVPLPLPDYSRKQDKNSNQPYMMYSKTQQELFKAAGLKSVNIFRLSNLEIWPGMSKVPIKYWRPAGTNWADGRCLSFSTPLPPSRYTLDSLLHFVAEYDVSQILHGWWGCPENGEHEGFRKFYTAFRNIPEGDFELIKGTNDPVAIRAGEKGFYLVNREPYPVTLSGKIDGKDFVRKLEASALVYETRPSKPVFSEVFCKIPDSEKDELESCVEHLKNFVDGSSEEFKFAVAEMDKAFTEGRFSQVRHLKLTAAVREILQRSKVEVLTDYDYKTRKLKVSVRNMAATAFTGKVKVNSPYKAWHVKDAVKTVEGLKPGQRADLEFLSADKDEKLPHWGFRYTVTLIEPSKSSSYEYSIRFGTPATPAADAPKWGYINYQCHRTKKEVPGLPAPEAVKFSATYSSQWNSDGFKLKVNVRKDGFFPPQEQGNMWKDDSIQVYFDQKCSTHAKQVGYDADDVVFQVGLLNGKAEVWRETGKLGVVNVPVQITPQKGVVSYEVFFPKELLPQVVFDQGRSIGFAILINGKLTDVHGNLVKVDLTSAFGGNPYLHPERWNKISFTSGK